VSHRRGKGKPIDDPFVVPVDSKGKAKAKVVDTADKEVAVLLELEDKDEIFEDEQPVSDWQASGLEDDGKPLVYHEDLHKRR
jgi:hypothetical protein